MQEFIANTPFFNSLEKDILPSYIKDKRWFGGKSSTIKYVVIKHHASFSKDNVVNLLLFFDVVFEEAFVQSYFLPMAVVNTDLKSENDAFIANLTIENKEYKLLDAVYTEQFRQLIFNEVLLANNHSFENLQIQVTKSEKLKENTYINSRLIKAEQSNTSIIFNEKYILKLFRRTYLEPNPDAEVCEFLSNRKNFPNTPAFYAGIQVIIRKKYKISIALMQALVPVEQDAWEFSLKSMYKIFENYKTKPFLLNFVAENSLFSFKEIEKNETELPIVLGNDFYLFIQNLAEVTAQMHIVLGSEVMDKNFSKATYNSDHSVWLKNKLLFLLDNRSNLVENNLKKLDEHSLVLANQFLQNKSNIRDAFLDLNENILNGRRIRIHGDYHLGQILLCKNDIFVIDFEGEPESTIHDRKVKQTPLKDVAGMLRSFHYAIYSTIFNHEAVWNQPREVLFSFAEKLYVIITSVFLKSYIENVQNKGLDVGYEKEIVYLLKYCMLEKAIYELGYELNARPAWVIIPLTGLTNTLNSLINTNE